MRAAVPGVHAEMLKDPAWRVSSQFQTVFREKGKADKHNAFTAKKSMRCILFVDKY